MKEADEDTLARILRETLPLVRALETATWSPIIHLGKTEPEGWLHRQTGRYVLGVTKPEEDE